MIAIQKEHRSCSLWFTRVFLFASIMTMFNNNNSNDSFVLAAEEKEWRLLYEEDFTSTSFDDVTEADWVIDDYSTPFDDIMDDPGRLYQNDYGPKWKTDALGSFYTYRKEFTLGTDSWLTASMSARDWNKDNIIEDPPRLFTKDNAAVMQVPDYTGGVIFRNTKPLPDEYRIEYKLKTVDFGGKRNGSIQYDGRTNGYNDAGCKSQHPWGEGSKTQGWPDTWMYGTTESYSNVCHWQGVREGRYAYNGFHFMTICDFADPAPRNNHFWHYRRKVLMDSFSIHPDRVEGGGFDPPVCNSDTKQYYPYSESNFNTVNMWISGLPNWNVNKGGLTGNSQWFLTDCNGGIAKKGVESAAELLPELMGDDGEGKMYTFAIERNASGYTLEASGHFARVGEKTIRFFRPFQVANGDPIWHYNTNASSGEYNGQYNNDLVQRDDGYTWPDQWAADSEFPDYFVIGDLYTNVYEGSASLTDIKLYGWATVETAEPTASPTTSNPTTNPTNTPSQIPTDIPSKTPSTSPSQEPTTMSPSLSPTDDSTQERGPNSGATNFGWWFKTTNTHYSGIVMPFIMSLWGIGIFFPFGL
mmetsp:Transcript_26756/g.37727  ORF Transcript_26756/g.37727 Transcript_26756/m.37727 type:complete len:583 (+) Transcript_26756:85-1833(+)